MSDLVSSWKELRDECERLGSAFVDGVTKTRMDELKSHGFIVEETDASGIVRVRWKN